MSHPQGQNTEAEQVRAFFLRIAEGLSIETSSDLLHGVNSRSPRPAERTEVFRFEIVRGRDFGVGMPPLATCYDA